MAVGRWWLAGLVALTAALVPLGPEAARAAGTVTVTTCSEASLRSAITSAGAGGTVRFGCSGTITLASTITLGTNLTLDGSGQAVTISGGGTVQVFSINSGVTATLNALIIASGNTATSGGGIFNNGGTLSLTNSTVSGNTATSGGGIFNNGGTLSLTNSTVSGNTATDFGGGIFNQGGTLSVANSTFSGNRAATGAGGGGGGIWLVFSPPATVTNSTFSDNTVSNYVYGGGGIADYATTLAVANSTFTGNSAATACGGGMVNITASPLSVVNSTFSGNSALAGSGGGICGNATLANTILANSTVGGNCGNGTVTDNGGNLADDASCGFTQASSTNSSSTLDGSLGPLASNGGPTQTMALLPGSPAIGAGLAAVCIAPPVNGVDQRGLPRYASIRGVCDSGAYDTGGGIVPPLTLTGSIPLTTAMPARLGFAASNHGFFIANGVAGVPSFTLGYITFQLGGSTFTVRQPITIACSSAAGGLDHCLGTTGLVSGLPGFVAVPGTATLTLSGTISSGRGMFPQGATATVTLTISVSAAGVLTVTKVTVAVSGVNGGSPVATWTTLPSGTSISLDASAPLIP